MTLVIDLTAEDLKAGSHWLADRATPEFEQFVMPPPRAIIHPWPPTDPPWKPESGGPDGFSPEFPLGTVQNPTTFQEANYGPYTRDPGGKFATSGTTSMAPDRDMAYGGGSNSYGPKSGGTMEAALQAVTALLQSDPETADLMDRENDPPARNHVTLLQHTSNVLKHLETQLDINKDYINGLSAKLGFDVRRVVEHGAALHDIGKPLSYELAGGHRKQHEYTKPIFEKSMTQLGFSPQETTFAWSLFGHDWMGAAVQSKVPVKRAVDGLADRARYANLSPADLAVLFKLFYLSDTASYPRLKRNHLTESPTGELSLRNPDKLDEILSELEQLQEANLGPYVRDEQGKFATKEEGRHWLKNKEGNRFEVLENPTEKSVLEMLRHARGADKSLRIAVQKSDTPEGEKAARVYVWDAQYSVHHDVLSKLLKTWDYADGYSLSIMQLSDVERGHQGWLDAGPVPLDPVKKAVDSFLSAQAPTRYDSPLSQFREDSIQEAYRELDTPDSSNVYSFRYNPVSAMDGDLHVTFLNAIKIDGKTVRTGPGPVYIYSDVPLAVYKRFRTVARTDSAGKAVWDYLRIRGSKTGHRFAYEKTGPDEIAIPIPAGGIKVPDAADLTEANLGPYTRDEHGRFASSGATDLTLFPNIKKVVDEVVSRDLDTRDPADENTNTGGGWVENGRLHAYHVTDNPTNAISALERKRGQKLIDQARGNQRELGPGLYVTGYPEFWTGRATQKYSFLKTIPPDQLTTLLDNLQQKIDEHRADRYIADFEHDYGTRDINAVRSGKVDPELLITLAGQPYNIRFWQPEYLAALGITPGQQPQILPVELVGRFARLKRHITEEEADALVVAGYDGAYTDTGWSTNPELVIWNRNAVKRFGDWQSDEPLNESCDPFLPRHSDALLAASRSCDFQEANPYHDEKGRFTTKDNARSYFIQHRPRPDGPPAHDLLANELAPRDIYDHPEWYTGDPSSPAYKETIDALLSIRGNPDAEVTVYRSSPKNKLNTGDWVSLSRQYAAANGMADDPADDVPVFSYKVPSKHVLWAGDELNEFGYFPDLQEANPGPYHRDADGKFASGGSFTRQDVLDHIMSVNPPGRVANGELTPDEWADKWLSDEPSGYTRMEVHPDILHYPRGKDAAKVERYAEMDPATMPPIVIDSNSKMQSRAVYDEEGHGYGLADHVVIDGSHRGMSASLRGDPAIPAIVPKHIANSLREKSLIAEQIDFARKYLLAKGYTPGEVHITFNGQSFEINFEYDAETAELRGQPNSAWGQPTIERIAEKQNHRWRFSPELQEANLGPYVRDRFGRFAETGMMAPDRDMGSGIGGVSGKKPKTGKTKDPPLMDPSREAAEKMFRERTSDADQKFNITQTLAKRLSPVPELSKFVDHCSTRLEELYEDIGSEYELGTVEEKAIAVVLATWADSSHDDNPLSIFVQNVAAELFNIPNSQDIREEPSPESLREIERLAPYKGVVREVLNNMYNHTQEELQKAGIEDILLFRGMNLYENFNTVLKKSKSTAKKDETEDVAFIGNVKKLIRTQEQKSFDYALEDKLELIEEGRITISSDLDAAVGNYLKNTPSIYALLESTVSVGRAQSVSLTNISKWMPDIRMREAETLHHILLSALIASSEVREHWERDVGPIPFPLQEISGTSEINYGIDEVQLQPLSSFAYTVEGAQMFQDSDSSTSVIIFGRIPRERIFSTAVTGIGCALEHEFVVLGGVPIPIGYIIGQLEERDTPKKRKLLQDIIEKTRQLRKRRRS